MRIDKDFCLIMYGETYFYLDWLPFDTVTDCVINGDRCPPTFNHHGVKFVGLSRNQVSMLNHLICNNTLV